MIQLYMGGCVCKQDEKEQKEQLIPSFSGACRVGSGGGKEGEDVTMGRNC